MTRRTFPAKSRAHWFSLTVATLTRQGCIAVNKGREMKRESRQRTCTPAGISPLLARAHTQRGHMAYSPGPFWPVSIPPTPRLRATFLCQAASNTLATLVKAAVALHAIAAAAPPGYDDWGADSEDSGASGVLQAGWRQRGDTSDQLGELPSAAASLPWASRASAASASGALADGEDDAACSRSSSGVGTPATEFFASHAAPPARPRAGTAPPAPLGLPSPPPPSGTFSGSRRAQAAWRPRRPSDSRSVGSGYAGSVGGSLVEELIRVPALAAPAYAHVPIGGRRGSAGGPSPISRHSAYSTSSPSSAVQTRVTTTTTPGDSGAGSAAEDEGGDDGEEDDDFYEEEDEEDEEEGYDDEDGEEAHSSRRPRGASNANRSRVSDYRVKRNRKQAERAVAGWQAGYLAWDNEDELPPPRPRFGFSGFGGGGATAAPVPVPGSVGPAAGTPATPAAPADASSQAASGYRAAALLYGFGAGLTGTPPQVSVSLPAAPAPAAAAAAPVSLPPTPALNDSARRSASGDEALSAFAEAIDAAFDRAQDACPAVAGAGGGHPDRGGGSGVARLPPPTDRGSGAIHPFVRSSEEAPPPPLSPRTTYAVALATAAGVALAGASAPQLGEASAAAVAPSAALRQLALFQAEDAHADLCISGRRTRVASASLSLSDAASDGNDEPEQGQWRWEQAAGAASGSSSSSSAWAPARGAGARPNKSSAAPTFLGVPLGALSVAAHNSGFRSARTGLALPAYHWSSRCLTYLEFQLLPASPASPSGGPCVSLGLSPRSAPLEGPVGSLPLSVGMTDTGFVVCGGGWTPASLPGVGAAASSVTSWRAGGGGGSGLDDDDDSGAGGGASFGYSGSGESDASVSLPQQRQCTPAAYGPGDVVGLLVRRLSPLSCQPWGVALSGAAPPQEDVYALQVSFSVNGRAVAITPPLVVPAGMELFPTVSLRVGSSSNAEGAARGVAVAVSSRDLRHTSRVHMVISAAAASKTLPTAYCAGSHGFGVFALDGSVVVPHSGETGPPRPTGSVVPAPVQ